jgi:CRP-like cAMP-binding protein
MNSKRHALFACSLRAAKIFPTEGLPVPVENTAEMRPTFLLACGQERLLADLRAAIQAQFPMALIFQSLDGSDAMMKLRNAAPHVLIAEEDLPKLSGARVTDWMLSDPKFQDVAAILLAPVPEEEQFLDEVVVGRVQFLDSIQDSARLRRALTRALNFVTARDDTEFRLKFLASNDVLIREGEKANFVYILRRGCLRAFLRREGKEILLGTIEPGEFVGEMAYINGEPRSADVAATSDAELIEIPVDSLDHVLFQKPSWSKALMKTLSKRIKTANARGLRS